MVRLAEAEFARRSPRVNVNTVSVSAESRHEPVTPWIITSWPATNPSAIQLPPAVRVRVPPSPARLAVIATGVVVVTGTSSAVTSRATALSVAGDVSVVRPGP